jgi:hypothetical protein
MNRGRLFSSIEHIERIHSRAIERQVRVLPSDRPASLAPPPVTPRARAEQLFQRATLVASPAAAAAIAGRTAKTLPPTVVMPPPSIRDSRGRLNLSGGAINVKLVLDPAQLAELSVPNGAAPQRFRIAAGGHHVTGQLNPKGLRKALALLAEHGAENIVVLIQGKLEAGDVLTEAGLTAQLKGPRGDPAQ